MAPKKAAKKPAAPRAGRKQTKRETGEIERPSGSLATAHERTWAHRQIDHVIADERALGSARRPPAVTE